jgi:hypothetical protein
MTTKTSHYKVDNGDMVLVEFESGRRLLIDIRIRGAADDPNEDVPDVGKQLRERLEALGRDGQGRLYVDAFLLTHPDQDHISGLRNHFHLGTPNSWSKDNDKIFIGEMWSSPIVFRRADRKTGHVLCEDAEAWRNEARRRANLFKANGWALDGDRIVILDEDVDGKTVGLEPVLVRTGEQFSKIAGQEDASFTALLIAPMLADDDEEAEVLSKNNSSVVLRLTLRSADGGSAKYLFGGDAEVAIWERIHDRYTLDELKYDVLIAPHHCSWHSLSWDSWSKLGRDAKVSPKAREALGQAELAATILASSLTIKDDDNDPPCIRAKREYLDILKAISGTFTCLADEAGDEPFELTISRWGTRPSRRPVATGVAASGTGIYSTGVGAQPLGHG